MKKILAVASIGGHWVQLLRITRPLEEHYEVVYMSTHPKWKSMVGTCRFHTMMDFSRWDAWKMLPASFNILGILLKRTTGRHRHNRCGSGTAYHYFRQNDRNQDHLGRLCSQCTNHERLWKISTQIRNPRVHPVAGSRYCTSALCRKHLWRLKAKPPAVPPVL